MEKAKKNKLVVVGVTGLAVLGLVSSIAYYGVSSALASDSTNPANQIVKNIASKFGLDENEVQKVFDDTRVQAESDKLTAAVTAGTITEAQKSTILAKEAETKTAMDAIQAKDLTETEKQAEIKKLMDANKTWATDNNIPEGMMMGGRGGRGDKGGVGMGMRGGPAGDFRSMDSATVIKDITDRLTSAVTSGTITEAQKTLSIAHATEVQAKITEINNSTASDSEKQAQIKAIFDSNKTWMSDNGIPESVLRPARN